MKNQLKPKAKPLNDEERLSWNAHNEIFKDFARSSMVVILALADCKKRQLYREEYGEGEKGWSRFITESPWFNARDWTRQRRNQFKKSAEDVEQLSTAVDNNLLAGLTERAIRALRSTVPNPVWRGELVNYMADQGVQQGDINEGTIDRYYPRFLQAKEAEEEERKAEVQIGFVPDAEEEIQAEDAESEEEAAAVPSETENEKAVKHAAQKTEKRPEYHARGFEYGRLYCKNWGKIDDVDLDTPEAQRATEEMLDRIDEVNMGVRTKLQRAKGSSG